MSWVIAGSGFDEGDFVKATFGGVAQEEDVEVRGGIGESVMGGLIGGARGCDGDIRQGRGVVAGGERKEALGASDEHGSEPGGGLVIEEDEGRRGGVGQPGGELGRRLCGGGDAGIDHASPVGGELGGGEGGQGHVG